MDQIIWFYHSYVHGVLPHYGLFCIFRDICDGYYMADIYNILFIWDIYMMYFIYMRKIEQPELYTTNCFHNFSCSVIIPHLTVNQDKQKNFQIPSTHKDFLQCELGEVPSKIRKPIHCKLLSYSDCLPKTESDIFSHYSGIESRTLFLSIYLCSHGFYPL